MKKNPHAGKRIRIVRPTDRCIFQDHITWELPGHAEGKTRRLLQNYWDTRKASSSGDIFLCAISGAIFFVCHQWRDLFVCHQRKDLFVCHQWRDLFVCHQRKDLFFVSSVERSFCVPPVERSFCVPLVERSFCVPSVERSFLCAITNIWSRSSYSPRKNWKHYAENWVTFWSHFEQAEFKINSWKL